MRVKHNFPWVIQHIHGVYRRLRASTVCNELFQPSETIRQLTPQQQPLHSPATNDAHRPMWSATNSFILICCASSRLCKTERGIGTHKIYCPWQPCVLAEARNGPLATQDLLLTAQHCPRQCHYPCALSKSNYLNTIAAAIFRSKVHGPDREMPVSTCNQRTIVPQKVSFAPALHSRPRIYDATDDYGNVLSQVAHSVHLPTPKSHRSYMNEAATLSISAPARWPTSAAAASSSPPKRSTIPSSRAAS